jgi:hypothetical protein
MRIQIPSRNYCNITCIHYPFFNSLACLCCDNDKVCNYFPHKEQQLMLICNKALYMTATSVVYAYCNNPTVFTHTGLIIL